MSVTVRAWDQPTSWNTYVASVPSAHFQQSWEWGELAPRLGGEAVRLAALDRGQIAGAMQVFVNRVGGIGRSLLYVPRGPALCEPSVDVVGPLLDAARELGVERRSIGLRVEPNLPASDTTLLPILRAFGTHPTWPPSQPRSSWVLDIADDEETLLAAMKSKTRYNIRLAGRKGVEVSEAGPDDLDEFYALYQVTAERDDFAIHSRDLYARMFDLFRQGEMFTMLFARYKGELIAATTLIFFGTTCWYLHGASSNEHRNLMATYLLQWEGITRARARGCTLYDFRAIPDVLREDQDMFGVYRFKEGFGGRQLTTMHTETLSYHPALFGLWQAYFSGRFAFTAWQRRRAGLPARQFA